MPKPDLPLPVLTPAAAEALDRAFQHAYGRLVAARITEARMRLVEAYGDLYSQGRVARRLGKSQTWLSNLEVGQRRIDTTALLLLGTLYGVPLEMIVMPAAGRREIERMTRWMREYRALLRAAEPQEALRANVRAVDPMAQRPARPRR